MSKKKVLADLLREAAFRSGIVPPTTSELVKRMQEGMRRKKGLPVKIQPAKSPAQSQADLERVAEEAHRRFGTRIVYPDAPPPAPQQPLWLQKELEIQQRRRIGIHTPRSTPPPKIEAPKRSLLEEERQVQKAIEDSFPSKEEILERKKAFEIKKRALKLRGEWGKPRKKK